MSLDLIEEKNLSESALKERFIAMEQLMTILYCREVFRDFRKPVEVMYPHLAVTYHSVIKRPMDLGTLLLKTMKREVLTVHELRTNLQLVHNNAMYFNEGAPLMEAVSRHLEQFSAGLFEEIMRFPYHVSGGAGSKGSGKPDTSHNVRLEKRRLRLLHIRDQTLEYSEVRRLLGILSNQGGIPVPEALHPALARARAALAKRLSLGVSPEDAQWAGVDVGEVSTLRGALQPILEAATLPPMAGNIPALGAVLVHCLLPAAPGQGGTRLRTECLAFIGHLEEQIGLLAVLVEERLLRGTPYSSIWAAPAEKLVYAQSISTNPSADGKNRSPWWPCLVIAAGTGDCSSKSAPGGANASSAAPLVLADGLGEDSNSIASAPQPQAGVTVRMAPELVRANLARFPPEIVKQLNKLKPRTATAHGSHTTAPAQAPTQAAVDGVAMPGADPVAVAPTPTGEGSSSAQPGHHAHQASALVVPEGYLLLEYFGAHDFGWVKADAVYPLYSYATAPDGTVEVVKGAAPGKLSYKDSVVEAEEAWRALHRRRRRAGLVQCPSKIRRASGPAIGASGAEAAAEDDDANFLLATTADGSSAGASGTGGDSLAALSPESDDEAEAQSGEDLIAPPSMEALEESVEVPVAIVGAAVPDIAAGAGGALSGAVGGAAAPTTGKASGSKSGGKRKAPTPSLPTADGLFDSLTNLGASPAGQGLSGSGRKGHGHGAAGRGGHYTAADDRRLYLASPEEILRYRSGVEYILPENLRVENLRRCCEDGRFKTSLCPLPLPTMQDMASPRHKPGDVKRESSLGDSDVITVDPKVRVTFRPKALMRTRALSYYLNAVRPLHFEHYMPTPSKKGFPAIPPSLTSQHSAAAAHAVSLAATGAAPSAVGLGTVPTSASQPSLPRPDDAQSTGDSDLAGLLIVGEDTTATAKGRKSGGEAGTGKGEKRKYHPKQKVGEDGLLPDGTHAPITAANIHIPANLSLSASCFILDAGCTRYAAGEGSVYTRVVDLDAKLFHLESRSRAVRKRILRQELASLQAAIEQLQQVSQQRQLRENERKLRFQQLQQQQLQQQLQQQQQYALAAQQHQHQQYLMKLIDQQQQQQQQQLQGQQSPRQLPPALPSVALPPKKAPAKPKAPKQVPGDGIPVEGVEGAAPVSKPRPKPQTTITYAAVADGGTGLVSADSLGVTLPPKAPSRKKPRPAPVVGPDGQVIEGAPAAKRPKAQKAPVARPEEALSATPGSPAGQAGSSTASTAATPDLSVLASAAASILEAAGLGSASPRF